MKQIGSDIFIFENIVENFLIEEFINLRLQSGTNDRINIFEKDKKLFFKFVDFWDSNIENKYYDYYFAVYDVKNGIGYNTDSVESAIKNLKNWLKTKWRDAFLLHYIPDDNSGYKKIHWDFSGITTIIGLTDEYIGGELVFPLQNVEIQIKKSDLVVFPGGITHPHYVKSIISGKRDVLVAQSMTVKQDHFIDY